MSSNRPNAVARAPAPPKNLGLRREDPGLKPLLERSVKNPLTKSEKVVFCAESTSEYLNPAVSVVLLDIKTLSEMNPIVLAETFRTRNENDNDVEATIARSGFPFAEPSQVQTTATVTLIDAAAGSAAR